MIKNKCSALLLATVLFTPSIVIAHGGGLGADGCHRDSARNSRHCHGKKDASPESVAHQKNRSDHKSPDEYDRDSWRHWSDLDGDGRDTRQQMLEEQSLEPVIFKDGSKTIARGLWRGAYTGKRGSKASAFHIDHIIALGYASRAGGRTWSPEKKEAFANDPINLVISTASANTSKSDRGPEEWMPKIKKIHCGYLTQWTQVAAKYQLDLLPGTRQYIKSRSDCQISLSSR